MYHVPQSDLRVHPTYQPIFRALALTPESLFTYPDIKVWRTLPHDRENATLDTTLDDKPLRLHIKRYAPARTQTIPADTEAQGHQFLTRAQIPTADLVAWGQLPDRRSFTIFADLKNHTPADKLLATRQATFDQLLKPTATLAANLHNANLHHRDLYLCHFLADVSQSPPSVKLIDVARVAPLTNPLTRKRWLIKDLAQFWYSTLNLPVTDEQRHQWLQTYAHHRSLSPNSLLPAIHRKSNSIARHDARLKQHHPTRNVSIPT